MQYCMLSSSTILQLDSMGSCTVQGQGIYLSLAGSLQPAFSSLDLHDAEISPLSNCWGGGGVLSTANRQYSLPSSNLHATDSGNWIILPEYLVSLQSLVLFGTMTRISTCGQNISSLNERCGFLVIYTDFPSSYLPGSVFIDQLLAVLLLALPFLFAYLLDYTVDLSYQKEVLYTSTTEHFSVRFQPCWVLSA